MNQNLIVRWSLWKFINMSKGNLNRKFAMTPRLRSLALFCLVILFLFIFDMILVLKQENQELQSEIRFLHKIKFKFIFSFYNCSIKKNHWKRDLLQQKLFNKNYSSPLYYDEPDFFRSIEMEIPLIFTAETADSMMTKSDIEDCECVKGETEESFNIW